MLLSRNKLHIVLINLFLNLYFHPETNQLVESVKNLIHTKYNLQSYLPTFFINNYAEEDCADLQEELAGLETFFKNMTRMELKVSFIAS